MLMSLCNKLGFSAYQIFLKLPLSLRKLLRRLLKRATHTPNLSIATTSIDFINQILAVINPQKSIFYIQPTFMNFLGTDFYSGGAERYALDLNKLFQEVGYDFYCIQYSSSKPWIRHYYGLTIIGLPSFYNNVLFQQHVELLTTNALLIISSPFTLVKKGQAQHIIGISHGIYWDTCIDNQNATLLAQKINYLDRLVSVDTATINFIRSHCVAAIHKINYIPNCVVHEEFTYNNLKKNNPELVILYPRRLYAPRGFWIVHAIIPKVLKEFSNVRFIFCGTGEENALNAVKELTNLYGNKVQHIVSPPDEMPAIYQQADIVLVPTIHSEGTSLSVIEAMATKKAVIATYVGGLTDLITDQFTGLIIPPDNENELYNALKKLIIDKNLREYIQDNAYKKSLAFNFNSWQQKWITVFNSLIRNFQNRSFFDKRLMNFSILHLNAGAITFDNMVQRPQQLFTSLAALGVNTMFIEDKSGDYQKPITKKLLLAGLETKIDFSGYVVYTYLATNFSMIKKNRPRRLIYDVLDHPDIHASETYLNYHQLMLNEADIILTSSQLLFDEYVNLFKKKIVRYVPNAANPVIHTNCFRPSDFPNYSKQTIGFYGALAEWFDFELLNKLCKQFIHCQIVLLGPYRENFPEYQQLQKLLKDNVNLFYLGVKKFTELSHYANYFNVAIIPFICNSITENCSPVKLFEYMHYSAPIVTTNMPECKKYQSALVAKTDEEFLSLIDYALKLPKDHEYFQLMKKEATENTWAHRSNLIIEAINASLNAQ